MAHGSGMPQQARAQAMDNSDSLGSLTEKPIPMDEYGHQRSGYAYKGEAPWYVPPVKDSDATVFHSIPIDNATP
jgi:hypothetical protein